MFTFPSFASDIAYLTENEYVELYAIQYSGVNTVDIRDGSWRTFMAIHLLSI
ncbi:hypothetical protein ES708_17599 [subsurface metagenome]